MKEFFSKLITKTKNKLSLDKIDINMSNTSYHIKKENIITGKYSPKFDSLFDSHIKTNSTINPHITYRNKIYWNPKFYLQKNLSFEFKESIKKFRRINNWTELDHFALIQCILTEAIRDTTYKLAYDFECKLSSSNPFHGLIPILIYNSDSEN